MASDNITHPTFELKRVLRWLGAQRLLHFLLWVALSIGIAQYLHRMDFGVSEYIDRSVLSSSFTRRGSKDPRKVATQLPHTKDIIVVELNHGITRPLLTRLLRQLKEARVVALDLMLVNDESQLKPEERELYQNDIAAWNKANATLAQQIRANGNVVLGVWPESHRSINKVAPGAGTGRTTKVAVSSRANVSWQQPPPIIWNSTRYHAHLQVEPDPYDNVVRYVRPFQLQDSRLPCMGLAVAALARGLTPEAMAGIYPGQRGIRGVAQASALDDNGLTIIDYVGGQQCFSFAENSIQYYLALTFAEPADFKDKIVFVGETSLASKDTFTTPFDVMPGVMVHANATATYLNPQGPPTIVGDNVIVLVALLCCLLLVAPLLRLSLLSCLAVALLEIWGVVAGAHWFFEKAHQFVTISVPVIAIALTYNGIVLYEYGRTRGVLAKFVGRDMLPRALNLFASLKLGGKVQEGTALFADLRGYSTLSEYLSPTAVSAVLNQYTDTLTRIVKKHHGRAVDFHGDGVFVLFEPGLSGKQHTLHAVQAAIEARAVFAAQRYAWIAEGIPSLEVGIGIHCGPMVIGVIGSEQNMRMSAVGDAVNVAARVQGLSKECGYDVLITSETFELVKDIVPAVDCGSFAVKGREQPVQVYGVGPPHENAPPDTVAASVV